MSGVAKLQVPKPEALTEIAALASAAMSSGVAPSFDPDEFHAESCETLAAQPSSVADNLMPNLASGRRVVHHGR